MGGGGVGQVPGGTRLGIGLSHDCHLGRWRAGWGSQIGGEIPSAAEDNPLCEAKMDDTHCGTRGISGVMGPRSKEKWVLRTAQCAEVRLPALPRHIYTNEQFHRLRKSKKNHNIWNRAKFANKKQLASCADKQQQSGDFRVRKRAYCCVPRIPMDIE